MLFSAVPDARRSASLCPPFAPAPFWSQGSQLLKKKKKKNPQKLRFILVCCSLRPVSRRVYLLWSAPEPRVPPRSISVRVSSLDVAYSLRRPGQTGCTLREGNITKKEGKRETEGVREGGEEGGDTGDHIWAVVTPWELQHSRVCRVFTVPLNS